MRRSSTVRMNHREFRQGEVCRIHLPRLSEKGKRSLPCSLTEHQNGTFRPIFASQQVQIRAQSVVRTPFRTVSPGTPVNRRKRLQRLLGVSPKIFDFCPSDDTVEIATEKRNRSEQRLRGSSSSNGRSLEAG